MRNATRILGVFVNNSQYDTVHRSPFLQSLASYGHIQKVKVIVFTLQDLHLPLKLIEAKVWCPVKGWGVAKAFLPELIYDRYFFETTEKFLHYKMMISQFTTSGHIQLLGKGLRGKWTIHQLMYRDSRFRTYIPETLIYDGILSLQRGFHLTNKLILKPQSGSQGKGMILLEKIKHTYQLKTFTNTDEMIIHSTLSLEHLSTKLKKFITSKRYIVQQFLTLQTTNDQPFDIRVLVQKNRQGKWGLCGLAVRIGKPGNITANLARGGKAEKLMPFLKTQFDEKRIKQILSELIFISKNVPVLLEKHHGRLLELGIDVGIDQQGKVWIIEANAKPGRQVFIQTQNQRAHKAAIHNIIDYAQYLLQVRPNTTSLSIGRIYE